jgi:hypothetical protein
VVCLEQGGDGHLYTLDGHYPVDLSSVADNELTKSMLRSVVSINNKKAVNLLQSKPLQAAWKRSAALRYLHPLILTSGHGKIGDEISCTLDPEFGLRIEEQSNEK